MSNTRATILSALASVGVVAGAWTAFSAANPAQSTAKTPAATPTSEMPTNATDVPTPDSREDASSTPSASPAAVAATAGLKDGKYSGTSSHRYGDIIVDVQISGGKITNVSATATAEDRKSTRIDNQALPLLRQQVLAAQSATIDGVSGATLTSTAYASSVQKALDDATAHA